MIVWKATVALALIAICASVESAAAQTPDPELDLCRSTGLAALRQLNPAIKDVSLDVEGMTVAKANTKIEDTPLKTVVIGDAYLKKESRTQGELSFASSAKKGKCF